MTNAEDDGAVYSANASITVLSDLFSLYNKIATINMTRTMKPPATMPMAPLEIFREYPELKGALVEEATIVVV